MHRAIPVSSYERLHKRARTRPHERTRSRTLKVGRNGRDEDETNTWGSVSGGDGKDIGRVGGRDNGRGEGRAAKMEGKEMRKRGARSRGRVRTEGGRGGAGSGTEPMGGLCRSLSGISDRRARLFSISIGECAHRPLVLQLALLLLPHRRRPPRTLCSPNRRRSLVLPPRLCAFSLA